MLRRRAKRTHQGSATLSLDGRQTTAGDQGINDAAHTLHGNTCWMIKKGITSRS